MICCCACQSIVWSFSDWSWTEHAHAHKPQFLTLARGTTLCDALRLVQVKREAEELAALNAREAAELAAAPAAATPTDADEEAAEEAVQTHAVSMLHACRSVDAYERLDRISEGTYGIVFR